MQQAKTDLKGALKGIFQESFKQMKKNVEALGENEKTSIWRDVFLPLLSEAAKWIDSANIGKKDLPFMFKCRGARFYNF